MEYKERENVVYDLDNLKIIHNEIDILSKQIEVKSLRKINIIWDNQEKCGEQINTAFKNRKIINVLVYGKTQTGKTGCMTAFINYYVLSNTIPIENIYIITGLSDKAWKQDTKNRMPDIINDRVYHRSNLSEIFVSSIKTKKNILIIMDEIQIAAKNKQSIYKSFEKCDFFNLNNLFKNDIKFVQFSATPDGHINDIKEWKEYSVILRLEPGKGYIGAYDLLKNKRVKEFKDLCGCDEQNKKEHKITIDYINEIKKDILSLKPIVEIINNKKIIYKRYHIIRIPDSKNNSDIREINNFKKVFGEENYQYNQDYLKKKKNDINDLLENGPHKDTFIFIKEILRCAKTQSKKYLGICHERYSAGISDSTIIQGTIGRMTGYDDNGDSICYTKIDTIIKYEKLWESKFIDDDISWNSKTTKVVNGKTKSTGTYNSTENVKGLEGKSSKIINKDRDEPQIKKFYGIEGEKKGFKWFNENLKEKFGGRHPNKTIANIDGYYIRPLGKGPNRKDIMTVEKRQKLRKWNLNDTHKYTWFPCYSDVNDKNTLEWWLIYYN
jgi:hypothetical protein